MATDPSASGAPGNSDSATVAPVAVTSAALGYRRHPSRQRWWWWAVMGVIVVAAIVIGAGSAPKTGNSDERLFSIAARLKCLQCVGESVASSQSSYAVQFREEIRKQMRQGGTDDEILNFFADSYGQEVLLTPPSSGIGGLVWVVPVVVAAGAVLLLVGTFRRWRAEREDVHASAEDVALVAHALGGSANDDLVGVASTEGPSTASDEGQGRGDANTSGPDEQVGR
ncbi:MAG TPA: cytochrome c-type biogenesis protein CcmH [Microthrixaceae bacterium]|nr:cytochrome c-type biogenesis protein CcmH [Microthrixaceae bacterium]